MKKPTKKIIKPPPKTVKKSSGNKKLDSAVKNALKKGKPK